MTDMMDWKYIYIYCNQCIYNFGCWINGKAIECHKHGRMGKRIYDLNPKDFLGIAPYNIHSIQYRVHYTNCTIQHMKHSTQYNTHHTNDNH